VDCQAVRWAGAPVGRGITRGFAGGGAPLLPERPPCVSLLVVSLHASARLTSFGVQAGGIWARSAHRRYSNSRPSARVGYVAFCLGRARDQGHNVKNIVVFLSSSAVEPEDACSELKTTDLAGKVALIKRGNCNFTEKIFRVQQKAGIAAVVYDSHDRERYVPRTSKIDDRNGLVEVQSSSPNRP
jgi:hypothetical protein